MLVLLRLLIIDGALKRSGLVVGAFAVGFAFTRCLCELFREPDQQLGFLWGSLTMGMLLSLPLMLAGLAFVWNSLHRPMRARRGTKHSAEGQAPGGHVTR